MGWEINKCRTLSLDHVNWNKWPFKYIDTVDSLFIIDCKLPNRIIWPKKIRHLGVTGDTNINFKSVTTPNVNKITTRGIFIKLSDVIHLNPWHLDCYIK
jgi:hypothetical protein